MPSLDQVSPTAMPKSKKEPVPGSFESKENEMIDLVYFEEAELFRPEQWKKDWGHGDKT